MTWVALQQIRHLQPYIPGMSVETLTRTYTLDPHKIAKLASNENPYGMSPKAKRAAALSLDSARRYPDGQELTDKLAQFYGLSINNIVLGNGSNDILDLAARVFLGPGTNAISSQYAFIIYKLATQITGAKNIIIPAHNFTHNLEAMLAAVTDTTRVMWIANPNNPTGTFVPNAQLDSFLSRVPSRVIVVLDQAYYEYLPPQEHIDAAQWINKFPNLIITRTFSKAYGMAGLRIGYALTSAKVAELMNRVRQPFNVSSIGLAAALASLDDQKFVSQSRLRNDSGIAFLTKGLDNIGLEYIESHGNFVTFKAPDAYRLNLQLLHAAVVARQLTPYGMPNYIRVSVGKPSENSRFLKTLADSLHR